MSDSLKGFQASPVWLDSRKRRFYYALVQNNAIIAPEEIKDVYL